MRKSRALALGAWDTTTQIMDIPYRTDVKILGFHFTNKVNTSTNETWSTVTTRVHALAQDTYYRNLSLDRRIHFILDYLLAKIWYAAQVYPHRPNTFGRLTPWYHGSSGEGKYSGFPYPPSSVGRWTVGGISWMCERRVEHYSYTEYKYRVSAMGHSLQNDYRNGTYTPGLKTPHFQTEYQRHWNTYEATS